MLDIKFVRENPQVVKDACRRRFKPMDEVVDEVIAIDAERRKINAHTDELKAEQNRASKKIPMMKKNGEDVSEIMAEMKKIAEEYDVTLTDGQIDSLISLCRSMEKLDTAALKEKVEQVQQYLKDIVSKQGEIKQFLSNVADTVTEFVNKVVDFIRGIFG